jgi:hypothetical protein
MEIIPEIPGWSIPSPPTTLPGDEPFVLLAMETILSRLQPDSAAISRVINYLAQKYSMDEQAVGGWSNYHILNKRKYESGVVGRGLVAGE